MGPAGAHCNSAERAPCVMILAPALRTRSKLNTRAWRPRRVPAQPKSRRRGDRPSIPGEIALGALRLCTPAAAHRSHDKEARAQRRPNIGMAYAKRRIGAGTHDFDASEFPK